MTADLARARHDAPRPSSPAAPGNCGAEGGKPRILYVSAVVPATTSGGRFAMYRHLVEKRNFEVAVAATTAGDTPVQRRMVIRKTRVMERLRRTRLARWVRNFEYVQNWVTVPGPLMRFARGFRPDAVFCVVEDWHMGLAWQVAGRLGVPLIVNFQDLFCLSRFVPRAMRPLPRVARFLLGRYRRLNREAAHVFYTSEGMREWMGAEGRGDVLYPVGDFGRPRQAATARPPRAPVRLLYAGNCYGAYGRMLLRLAEAVERQRGIQLRIFAAGNDWPAATVRAMREAGIYHGFKPFDALKDEFEEADAFLTVMSFEPDEGPFVRTSFTTKWLDYVPYGKPVFVWAPEYSTAGAFARKHQSGIVIAEDRPEAVPGAVSECAGDAAAWRAAGEGALRAADTVLNAEAIHAMFVERVSAVCAASRKGETPWIRRPLWK